MKRLFTTLLGLALLLPAMAQVPAGYYTPAEGLTGGPLKAALNDIISGHTTYPYTASTTDTWDILKEADRDPNNPNNVMGIYSGFSMDGPKEYDGGNGWNREHVWAKSRGDFGTTEGAGTDVHHLRAADVSTNSARNNRNFDECTDPYTDQSGQYSGATGSFTSSSSWAWEPRAEVKGDVARMIFYMATRYEGENGDPDLELTETMLSNTDKSPLHAKLSVLLTWHVEDPVDQAERDRNDVVYAYQNNRNPFIDHPEYVESIWGTASTPNLTFTSSPVTTATEGQAYTYSVTTANGQGTVSISATTAPAWLTLNDNNNGTATLSGTPGTADVASSTVTLSASDNNISTSQTFTLVVSGIGGGGGDGGSGGGGGPSAGQATELLFTEYIEGSSYNKGWEIANFTGADVNLSAYSVATQVNGSASWGSATTLSGTLTDGDVFVAVHTSADAAMQAEADLVTGAAALNFNGNDVVGLFKDGVLIDIIGIEGSSANFAQDVTLVRNSDVTSGTTTYNAAEWTSYATDEFSYLGSHQMDAPALATELLFSEYIEGSSFNKGWEITNYTGADVDLSIYSVATQVNGSTTWGSATTLSGTLVGGDVFVAVHTSADPAMQAEADLVTGAAALNFNGNDVVGLFKDGALIDKIGVSGSSANFGQDVTLVRNADVTAPATTYNTAEWTSYATDEFSYLGSHSMNGGGGTTPTAPAPPAATIAATQTTLTVSWGDVANEDSYEVYRSTNGNSFSLEATLGANTTSYADATVSQGTTYYYYVTATNAVGTSAASNTVIASPTTPPVSNGPELDIVTYNIEWLGVPAKAGLSISRDQQLTDAALDILDANPDIVALQEIVTDDLNGDALTDLVTKLNSLDGDTWAGAYNQYFSYWWNPDFANFPAQRQAYVYRTSTVSNVTFQTLLTAEVPSGDNRFASGRLPFMMSATVTIDGQTEQINLINLHLKCCTGSASRRLASMQTLDAELDANWANANVIVLGDMNVADNGGANGEMATWGLYDDSNSDGTADYAHAAGAVQDLAWDDLDHILISDEWNAEYTATDAALRNVTLSTRVSDHFPIKTTLTLQGGGTGDTEAPTTPTGLASANLTESSFTLSWSAASDNVGVTGYEVFQNGTSLGTTAGTTMNVTGLAAETSYSYTVAASDAAGNTSATSSALNVTTLAAPDTQAPSAPANLSSSNVGETNFTLSWSAATDNQGVTGYEVFQDGNSLGTTANTTLDVTGLTASTTYSYTVTASDAAGNSSTSAALNVTTADPTPVAAALYFSEYIEGSSFNKGLEIANSTGTTVDLSGYSVARQVNGAGAWDTPVSLSGSLANGDVYVIVNSSADAAMQAVADLSTGATAITFNGDDPVGLFFNGELLDVIGTFNDPTAYGTDVTLRRNDGITVGNTTYTTSEWTSYATDTFNGLGERSTTAAPTPDPMTNTLSMFAEQKGPNTRAYADVVVTSNGAPVVNAYVEVTWSGSESGIVGGFTDASGFVGFVTGNVKNAGSFTVTINTITQTGYTWDAANSTVSATLGNAREGEAALEATLLEGEIDLYPNPAPESTTLDISLSQAEDLSLMMYTLQGQQVYQAQLRLPAGNHQHRLDVSQLPEGMYLVQVQGTTTRETIRLVVR